MGHARGSGVTVKPRFFAKRREKLEFYEHVERAVQDGGTGEAIPPIAVEDVDFFCHGLAEGKQDNASPALLRNQDQLKHLLSAFKKGAEAGTRFRYWPELRELADVVAWEILRINNRSPLAPFPANWSSKTRTLELKWVRWSRHSEHHCV